VVAALRVQIGQQVEAGAVLLVLEAMKMENDITAPVGGVVKEILVEKGSAVSQGDALVVLG
jgi:biotin carboxyl carrier protein